MNDWACFSLEVQGLCRNNGIEPRQANASSRSYGFEARTHFSARSLKAIPASRTFRVRKTLRLARIQERHTLELDCFSLDKLGADHPHRIQS